MSEWKKGLSNSTLTTKQTDTTDPNFQGSDWQPNMFYDPDASKKDATVTISSHKLNRLRELLKEAQDVLEFYGLHRNWKAEHINASTVYHDYGDKARAMLDKLEKEMRK